ncbi:MAG TPA: MBL fold metallo-hydrolase, partial [Vicinamibacterales bacterium]
DLRRTFHYVFDDKPRVGGGVPEIVPHVIDGPFTVAGMQVVPIPVWHGAMSVLGFRFGGFVYLTDCNRLDEAAWPLLQDVDTLVLDALRDKPHATHFTVREALAVVERLAPRCAYLTHMAHDLGHRATNARLPAGVELAYDGLVIGVAVAPE